ncbi:uncharacterized protein LOC6594710 isoform X7 [Drosophila persimilis]|uniref:uncharacterized protein LOC6594710 isoform X7 n=1 Tax=Drosophila persimilis TaxID=7234 RepID=UPI000F0943BF|nr:uncharacterized protein LOC6594710 isoform X7 [Drosophila persimilis]
MIGSFWNLCRACPSMPVDKQLHSEYRSTYRWHEFTGNSRPEVVRRAPAPNQNQSQFDGPTNEPSMPRRKKCPELAYKSHEFIIGSEYTDARREASAHRLARSEGRGGTPSRRSKSEGPPVVPNGRAYPAATEIDGATRKQAGESNGLFRKTISKLSTEYRLQFVWPNVRRIKGGGEATSKAAAGDYPRKSISLGALRSSQSHSHTQSQNQSLNQTQTHGHSHTHQSVMGAGLPTVHKKRTTNQKEATLHELEPLVSDTDDRKTHEKQVTIVEHKARPFSQAYDNERINHFITKKENFGFTDAAFKDVVDNKHGHGADSGQVAVMNGTDPPHSKPNLDLWFKDMVELRKKAGEYKSRGWGREIDPELYKKQKDLWDQVSRRSSLSALSLASTVHRPITKEEKDQENNKKSAPLPKTPLKPRVPGQAYLVDNKDEISALPARFSNIRHHLERTTGPDVEEGALLPSPTREKLMPAITKRESESQRGSPKKTALSRHGSPQKGSPQKGSPKKVLKYDGEDGRETAISISSCSPQPPVVPEVPEEPLVKSPPEPTRVKSPEQIIMRSPDPVNWTVPLDTGKTFTVTQNVKDGENYSRPQSEIKASTPVEKPPPPPQSAPPQLTEQAKMDAWKSSSPTTSGGAVYGKTLTPHAAPGGAVRQQQPQQPVDQTQDQVLSSSSSTGTGSTARTTAAEVLEKARDRFDRFWGTSASKEESV